MILTNDFVVINYPKTGSTYLRACIKELYKEQTFFNKLFHKDQTFKELLLPKIYGNVSETYKDQHGVIRQIPEGHHGKPIITITRNPIQRIVSSYHFEWWKKNPIYDLSKIESHYPNYPDIDLITFAKLLNNPDLTPENLLREYADKLGYNTRLFLIYYSENPSASAERLVSENVSIKDVVKPNIHYLRQEQLQQDLMNFIKEHTSKEPELIRSVADKNSGSYTNEKQHPKEFTDYVTKMESHLFTAFYPQTIAL